MSNGLVARCLTGIDSAKVVGATYHSNREEATLKITTMGVDLEKVPTATQFVLLLAQSRNVPSVPF